MTNPALFDMVSILSVGFSAAAIAVLGIVVFESDKKSATTRAFLLFAILTVLWSVANFFTTQISDPAVAVKVVRVSIFLALWHAFTFFNLFYIFPAKRVRHADKYYTLVLIVGAVSLILLLTPLAIRAVVETGTVTRAENGPGIIAFALLALFFVVGGLYLLAHKFILSKGSARVPYAYMLGGAVGTFALLLAFNLALPAFLDNSRFVAFGGVYLLPFVLAAAYAIIRHRLFNVKVIASGVLVFILAIATFSEVVLSRSVMETLFQVIILCLVLAFGALLIRSVIVEVDAKEEKQRLADGLAKANMRLTELDKRKSEFVSISSHQLRTPLTAIKGYSSLLLEGSYGPISKEAREPLQKIFDSSTLMAVTINDFLNVARIEEGQMHYEYSVFDVRSILSETVSEFAPIVEHKGLDLKYTPAGVPCMVRGDTAKVRQVLSNLIDNAVRYTQHGEINVSVKATEHGTVIAIADTGIGMSQSVQNALFEKFMRADNAARVAVAGTGLGLYVNKQMVEAMDGRIWAESEGEGKGSTFYVELPPGDEHEPKPSAMSVA